MSDRSQQKGPFLHRRLLCVASQGSLVAAINSGMQTAKDAREARRKRILARGSDRLAYITGDLSKQHSLRASSISSSQEADPLAGPLQTDGDRSSFESHDAKPGNLGLSDLETEHNENFQEPVSCSQPFDSAKFTAVPSDTTTPVLTSRSRHSAEHINGVPTVPSPSSESSQRRTPGVKEGKKPGLLYVKDIIYSIKASESLRALAAAVVAVFVVSQMVLSCCGHPWGDALAVLLPRWPIGLVFSTDLFLIIGAYLIHSTGKSSQTGLGSMESTEPYGKLDQISQALDVVGRFEDLLNIGLLCKKAAGAISLDCSIYVVTIVCGFSVSQYAFSCCRDF